MIYYHYPPYYFPNTRYVPPKFHDENTKNVQNVQKEIPKKQDNNVIFEIFGISLYFDDILLICLIFFLYNEGVKDQYLFIALILLLLS